MRCSAALSRVLRIWRNPHSRRRERAHPVPALSVWGLSRNPTFGDLGGKRERERTRRARLRFAAINAIAILGNFNETRILLNHFRADSDIPLPVKSLPGTSSQKLTACRASNREIAVSFRRNEKNRANDVERIADSIESRRNKPSLRWKDSCCSKGSRNFCARAGTSGFERPVISALESAQLERAIDSSRIRSIVRGKILIAFPRLIIRLRSRLPATHAAAINNDAADKRSRVSLISRADTLGRAAGVVSQRSLRVIKLPPGQTMREMHGCRPVLERKFLQGAISQGEADISVAQSTIARESR